MAEIGNWVKILILPLTSLVTLGDIVGLLWGPISQSLYLAHFVHGLYSPWNSSGRNTGMGSWSLLQGIFPIQGSNWCLLHCSWILYQLSFQGSPLEIYWVGQKNRLGFSVISYRKSQTFWSTQCFIQKEEQSSKCSSQLKKINIK